MHLIYRVVLLITFLSCGFILVNLIRFMIIIKNSENKYVYEIEPQLNAILRLVIVGVFIMTVFGITGIILKVLIYYT